MEAIKAIHPEDIKNGGEVTLPFSKSVNNRLMIINFLAGGELPPPNELCADDTVILYHALQQLRKEENGIKVFDVKNAGTVMRFLTAVLAITPGEYMITGSPRMLQRPIQPLVRALTSLGADIRFMEKEGFPPLRIIGKPLEGGTVFLDSSLSSQYVSALLMIAPRLRQGLKIHLSGKRMSSPYISMTVNLMIQAGAEVDDQYHYLQARHGDYHLTVNEPEADWSSAAFFYELAALLPGSEFLLKGLKSSSLQGDAVLPGLYDYLGVETLFTDDGVIIRQRYDAKQNISVDFSDYPDLALPYIATCAGLNVIGRFTGLETLKHKESNRIEALAGGLAQFDFDFRETGMGEWVLINSCKTTGPQPVQKSVIIDPHNDHRIAMAMAPLAVLTSEMKMKNPDVVEKSYPAFWDNFLKR